MVRYPVRVAEDDNNTILVTFPDFPEAHTFGDTLARRLNVHLPQVDRLLNLKHGSKLDHAAHLIDVLSADGKSRGTGIVTVPVAAHSVPRWSRTM